MVHQAAAFALDLEQQRARGPVDLPTVTAPTGPIAESIGDVAKYCAGLAFGLAKAIGSFNHDLESRYRQELQAKFGTCDARYVEAAEQTAAYFGLMNRPIPYVDFQSMNDFVIDDGQSTLPSDASIAVIGDWGTGQNQALKVLESLAAKQPDVVVHLGDVYYSGIDAEEQHYFFDNWCRILGLAVSADTREVTNKKPATFSLAGNHDMYCGGAPYYKMITQLGQPASFFCLRNDSWQLIGLDTGYNDHSLGGICTRLPPRQADWLKDKVDSRSGRKTVLLSHHQLFSNQDTFSVDGQPSKNRTNPRLLEDVQEILAQVSLWLWGHEHAFVAYESGPVRARCIGHGAYPVGLTEIPDISGAAEFALDQAIAPQQKGQAFYDNGYALLRLNGPTATVTYYAVDEDGNEREESSVEEI